LRNIDRHGAEFLKYLCCGGFSLDFLKNSKSRLSFPPKEVYNMNAKLCVVREIAHAEAVLYKGKSAESGGSCTGGGTVFSKSGNGRVLAMQWGFVKQ
jgi:hypothetical protein